MNDEDESAGIPEWVVTFGDMMSLLLTFFIMLVSLSEIKQDERYQNIVESIKRRFGHELTTVNVTPGESRPRETQFRVLSTMGRAKKKDTHKGGVPTKAPDGEQPRVRIVRPGSSTAIGTVLFFSNETYELNEETKRALDLQMAEMAGKPQKIEIRGHTSQVLALQGIPASNAMDLSYKRCRNVMQYLIENHNVPPERVRLSTAGAWEPMFLSGDAEKMRMNPRVEVFLLEETVEQLLGTPEERESLRLNP